MSNVLSGADVEGFDLGYTAGSRFRTVDGLDIYYEEYGRPDGTPIVFLNNLFLIATLWRNFTTDLAKKYRIIAYDLRNQGVSTRVEEGLSFTHHLDDLDQLLRHLNVQKPILVGTSDSTLIARDFASRHPGRVAGIALYGPVFNKYGGRRRKRLLRSWAAVVRTAGTRGLFDVMFPLLYSHHTVEQGGNATYLALRERFLALNSEDQLTVNLSASIEVNDDTQKLAELDCATLLAVGDGDFFASRESLAELAAIIPDATVAVLEDSGHAPYFEATDQFEATLDHFIDTVVRP